MFDPDPDHMQRRVSDWAQGFADKAAQVYVMRAQVEHIQACASSPDGAVRVTVDSRGLLTTCPSPTGSARSDHRNWPRK
jgi:hypothetical protein